MPPGCSFHPRCGYAFDRCRTDPPPPLLDLDAGTRAAACWLQDGHVAVPAELARPVPAAPVPVPADREPAVPVPADREPADREPADREPAVPVPADREPTGGRS
jgi:hypothetical protein